MTCERHTVASGRCDQGENGAALITVLLALGLLTALGVTILMLVDTDRRIAASFETGAETFYAADAGLEWTIQDLHGLPIWSDVLSGLARSTLTDSTRQLTFAGWARLDLDAITGQLQTQSNAVWTLGPNTPVWRLFAWGPLATIADASPLDARAYVAAWVADDPSEIDGNPLVDENGVLMVHVEAFGAGGSRRILEGTVAQDDRYRRFNLEPTGTLESGGAGAAANPGLKTVISSAATGGVKLLFWREVR